MSADLRTSEPRTPDASAANTFDSLSAAVRNEARIIKRLTATHRSVEIIVGNHRGLDLGVAGYVRACCPRYPADLVTLWCQRGDVLADGMPCRADAPLRPGLRLSVRAPLPPPDPTYTVPPLVLAYVDARLAVADKPLGHLAHQAGTVMSGTLLNQLIDFHAARGGDPNTVRLVNRIDRDTSGLILVSFDLAAHVALSDAIAARQVTKEYLALCHGVPEPVHGHWRDAIGLPPGAPASSLRVIRPDGQDAHTEYHVEATTPDRAFARLRITLHTGRQHQIRLHASHHGHPLIGDWCYPGSDAAGLPIGGACAEIPGQALHAARLDFPHPDESRRCVVASPLSPPLVALWQHLCAGGRPTPRALSERQRGKLGLKSA